MQFKLFIKWVSLKLKCHNKPFLKSCLKVKKDTTVDFHA